jgi:methionine biosynthesis protein MetW
MDDRRPRAAGLSAAAEIYDQPINLGDPDSSHALMLQMIRPGTRVLEFGCATGRMSELLRAQGSSVTGIEIDPACARLARQFADAVHEIDLDVERASQRLAGERFDVLVFGDVLEHLRDPETVLRDALKLLTPGGEVVVSIPNMAHADVRLSLLEGQVTYGDCGLLDRTHLRWFTRDSLELLLTEAGLEPVQWERTRRAVGATEIPYRREAIPQALRSWVAEQPEATTYQFVVRSRRRTALPAGTGSTATLVDWSRYPVA